MFMQELQANNIALLSAVRQLSDEQDRTREEVRAEVQAEKEAHLEELRAALNNMRQLRENEEVLYSGGSFVGICSLYSEHKGFTNAF